VTLPPLPASPVLRVALIYTHDSSLEAGQRFYLSYSGSAPSGSNCATLAGDIAGAWNTDLAAMVNGDWTLTGVDVIDIATRTGASGTWDGSHAGTDAGGDSMPAQTAMNIEFNIARRYRGGKPRTYLPPGCINHLVSDTQWNSSWVTDANSNWGAFMTAIEALDVGSLGTLAHVNLSYYHGFTNVENTSGRMRAAPTYKDSATLDTVTGYSAKQEVSSQRRRRTSTTP
jgi:hypothetical protein